MPPRDRTRRRIQPRQQRAQLTVDSILTAAERVMTKEGYAKTTTNHIAEVAGVNIALVYRYFAGKEAIVGALIERWANRTAEALEQTLARHADAPLPETVRAIIEVLVKTPGLPDSLHRELVNSVELTKRRAAIEALRARAFEAFVEDLQRRRVLARAAEGEARLFVLARALEAVSHAAAFERPAGISLDTVIEVTRDMVLGVLEAPRSASRPRARRSGAAGGAA
ncbi:TetR/AcrR family transcriptional regulator [Myxococcus sp. K15C18031901]|uniref:TetR/AcrR family transcriptional regulator n=1 Tax=Myxococcus dinghuensis TaxID=2906761 RepID=UPI0020A7BE82|nr:TetR/AcrR family transcriptional regulator [Myxococcus dinghuensis]MCP3102038.1 TetR/AcrR family transcriptional regulator [Myxococcus dinghuensis]